MSTPALLEASGSPNTDTCTTQYANSHLMHLPAELRNLVYFYVLGGKTWLIWKDRARSRVDGTNQHPLALLRVNCQIHSEASLFPYVYNTFEARHDGHLKDWIDRLSDRYRNAITSIKRHQRSYIVQGVHGLEVSPVFWMAIPNMGEWGLSGLKRLVVEVGLYSWRWGLQQRDVDEAKSKALEKLRELLEEQHPGVQLVIV